MTEDERLTRQAEQDDWLRKRLEADAKAYQEEMARLAAGGADYSGQERLREAFRRVGRRLP